MKRGEKNHRFGATSVRGKMQKRRKGVLVGRWVWWGWQGCGYWTLNKADTWETHTHTHTHPEICKQRNRLAHWGWQKRYYCAQWCKFFFFFLKRCSHVCQRDKFCVNILRFWCLQLDVVLLDKSNLSTSDKWRMLEMRNITPRFMDQGR